MSYVTNMDDYISIIKNRSINNKDINQSLVINHNNLHIVMKFNSYYRKYKDYIDENTINVKMNNNDILTYFMNPKKLSNDLYGTTVYWALLMEINNIVNLYDFKLKTIRVILPDKINTVLENIINNEI